MKKYIIGFILGLIVATTIGVSATVLYQADEVEFTPDDPNWNVKTIEDALNDLYQNKGGTATLYDKTTVIGNTTTTYTFQSAIKSGIIIISSSNDTNLSSLYVADIESLSDGNYTLVDDQEVTYSNVGHRTKIFNISNVPSGATMQIHTRYAGIMHILKLN